jgi:hypothetical protein
VDAKNFKATVFIWHANINFTIETTGTTERGINSVRAVSSANDDDLTTAFNTVHQGEELSDNTLLHLTLGFLSVGSDRINLINKEDGGLVSIALFEGLSEVLFGLTLHL